MSETRWLTEPEGRAWRGYLRMRALLDLQIRRDLAQDSDMSPADHHVLATLSAHQDQRMRLSDLADSMLWSTSRVTHHLDRMERRGLIQRSSLPSNSRAAVVHLTPEGREVLTAAAPLHVQSVRRHFIDLLTEAELDAIAAASERVVSHLRELDAAPGE